MRSPIAASVVVIAGLACVEPAPAPPTPPALTPAEPGPLEINVEMSKFFIVVYARDPTLECDCQDGTFSDVGVCRFSSDVTLCQCEPAFPVSTAPCLESITVTHANVDPPLTYEFSGGSVAFLRTFVDGIDVTRDEFTLRIVGCDGEMEFALPLLPERAPRITRAARVDGGVRLELADAQERVVFDAGSACGEEAANDVVVLDEWTADDIFGDTFGGVKLRSLATSADGDIGTVRVWHDFFLFNSVAVAPANADGSLDVPVDRGLSVELKTADADTNQRADDVTVRASADGEVESLSAVIVDADPELPVDVIRVTFADPEDRVELDMGPTTFVAVAEHRDRGGAVFDASGFHVDWREALTFVDEAGVAPPLEATLFHLHLSTRTVFVGAIE